MLRACRRDVVFFAWYAYHKGLGRFLGAFPSDTGIFTTGNGPGKFNGPFNFQYRDLTFIEVTLFLQKC